MWYLKKMNELSAQELYRIYQARVAVFVVEQQCFYQEVDELDQTAWHLFEIEKDQVISYARIIPEKNGVRIGRILIAQPKRGQGKGRYLLERAIEICSEWFIDQEIHIQAQAYLQQFYESVGFVATSGLYLEDGIEHLDMRLN